MNRRNTGISFLLDVAQPKKYRWWRSMPRPRWVTTIFLLILVTCSPPQEQSIEINHFSFDSLEGRKAQSGVELDAHISHDGQGSWRITADDPRVVKLVELTNVNLTQPQLRSTAWVRTDQGTGYVYFELRCRFANNREVFARTLGQSLSSPPKWKRMNTQLLFKQTETPTTIELNLVINGQGTVWVDDVHLFQSSHKS